MKTLMLSILLCGSAHAGTLVTSNEVSTTSIATLASTQTWTGTDTFLNPIVVSSAIAVTEVTSVNTLYSNNMIKAWVNFNGVTAAINDGVNVSSITYIGTGNYSINWNRDFSNNSYAVVCTPFFATGINNSGYAVITAMYNNSVVIQTEYTGNILYNAATVQCIAMGTQ